MFPCESLLYADAYSATNCWGLRPWAETLKPITNFRSLFKTQIHFKILSSKIMIKLRSYFYICLRRGQTDWTNRVVIRLTIKKRNPLL
jgi:hypothetical protein